MPPRMIAMTQIIDLAIGMPEAGCINYNALHALLHIIVENMNMHNSLIEFDPKSTAEISTVLRQAPAKPVYQITSFDAENDDGTGTYPNRVKKDKPSFDKVDTILVVRKGATSTPKTKPNSTKGSTPSTPTTKPNSTKESTPSTPTPTTSPVSADPSEGPPPSESGSVRQPIEVPETNDFRELVKEPTSTISEPSVELPSTSELVESLGDNQNAVSDMYNILNLSKRLDATEVTIKKVLDMLKEVGTEYNRVNSLVEGSMRVEDIASIKDQLDNIEQKIHTGSIQGDLVVIPLAGQSLTPKDIQKGQKTKTPLPTTKQTQKQQQPKHPQQQQDDINKVMYPKVVQSGELPGLNKSELECLKSDMDYIKMAVQRLAKCAGQKDIDAQLTKEMLNLPCPGMTMMPQDGHDGGGRMQEDEERLRAFEVKYEQLESRLVLTDKRVYDLEKEFGEISDRLEDLMAANEARAEQDQDVAALIAQMGEIKSRLNQTFDKCKQLSQTEDQLQILVNQLREQVKSILETKIDREEVDELMADKADYNLVQRKVSSDHFDATKRELGLGLDEISAKIAGFDDALKKNIEVLRMEMIDKMNRHELEKIREFFLSKLQLMQDRLKAMASSRQDPEAAGTKSKYLRDVECISCEQKVVMRRDEIAAVPQADPLVAMKSIRPQLTYELDNLRKELRQCGTTRNMHHFEEMYNKGATKQDKFCNRYCGGSHTLISAQEQQKRHFVKQHGKPNQSDILVRGTDGGYYKSGRMEECRCVEFISAKTPAITPSTPTAPPKTTPPKVIALTQEMMDSAQVPTSEDVDAAAPPPPLPSSPSSQTDAPPKTTSLSPKQSTIERGSSKAPSPAASKSPSPPGASKAPSPVASKVLSPAVSKVPSLAVSKSPSPAASATAQTETLLEVTVAEEVPAVASETSKPPSVVAVADVVNGAADDQSVPIIEEPESEYYYYY